MSVLSGLIHQVGNVVGPVAQGVGTAYDYLTPGTGSSTLTNAGKAISDPNQVYSGATNPFGGLLTNASSGIHNGGTSGFTQVSPASKPLDIGSQGQTLGVNTNTQSGSPGVVGGGAAPTPQTQAQYDQSMGFLNAALGRLPTSLGIAQGNINGQYNTNNNELDTGKTQANQQYQQGTNQNTQQYVGNKNQITDQASAGLHSLLRFLGMNGAGGSSDYQFAAPQAVATQASQQQAGAGQTFGQNQQGLDTGWNNYQTGFNQSKQKLNDWLSGQLNSAQSSSDNSRIGLLQSIAGLQPTVAQTQPYIDQMNTLNDQVDQLGRLNPTYTGTAPTYTAPNISSYSVNPAAPVQTPQNAAQSSASPFMSLLLAGQKDKNQQPAFNF